MVPIIHDWRSLSDAPLDICSCRFLCGDWHQEECVLHGKPTHHDAFFPPGERIEAPWREEIIVGGEG